MTRPSPPKAGKITVFEAAALPPREFDQAQADRDLPPVIRCPHCGSVRDSPSPPIPAQERFVPMVSGVGRVVDNERAYLVMVKRKLSDDQLRELHDYLRKWQRTPILAQGQDV